MHYVLASSASFEALSKAGNPSLGMYVCTQIIRQIIKLRLAGGVGGRHGRLGMPTALVHASQKLEATLHGIH